MGELLSGFIVRIYWTYSGLLMGHISFLVQLIIHASYGMLVRVRQLIQFQCWCHVKYKFISLTHFCIYSGSVHQILDAHSHYVQGVAWDPLGKYAASSSSDRTCRIYINKPSKTKGVEKSNYVCQHVILKAESTMTDESKVLKKYIFYNVLHYTT